MPTIKQKKAFDKIVENRGNIGKAMIEAGYDETTAKNPKNLTDSDGWEELMEEYLPDRLLGKKHRELLDKKEVKRTFQPEVGEWVEIETGQIDAQAVTKGLDMAYKLKAKYTPLKVDHSGEIGFNLKPKIKEQLMKNAEEWEKSIDDEETKTKNDSGTSGVDNI